MNREIHPVYDVILKMIVLIYGTSFLNYIGIEKEIKSILGVEFVTLTGKKYILDFLCQLDDDAICHIEFQFHLHHQKIWTGFLTTISFHRCNTKN